MSEFKQILTTKIQIPPLSPNLVTRKRLYEALDTSIQPIKRLTLISAPAGYGKTSLVSAWVQDRKHLTAWISIDEQDNDPIRFGSYLIAALERVNPELKPPELGLGPFSAGEFQQNVLIPLLNKLGQSSRTTLIVLDDFHWIQDSAVEKTMEFVLENLPASLHVITLTRADPALPIARLRGRGQLNELRMDELRFEPIEVESFLKTFQDIQLSEDDIQTLMRRTEGWIAGLQMAVVSLRGREDQSGFIDNFSGSHQYIMDFLLDEVLRRQTPRLQSFLLKTSILDRLSGPLCDAVLTSSEEDFPPSEEVLRELARANLFVVPLDPERQWFRYHRLFADLLQARLNREDAQQIRSLHRRASEWYEQHGHLDAAMQHALESGDFELAAGLLERVSESWLMRSETATFIRWLQRLPPNIIAARPRLVIFQAWALLFQGAPLRVVEALIPTDQQDDKLPGGSALIKAFLALAQGKVQKGLDLSEKALELLPEEEVFLRDFAIFCAAGARIGSGDIQTGQQLLEETMQSSLQSGNRSAAVIFLTELAEIRMKEMRLDESSMLYEQARTAATDRQGNLLPMGGRALIGLGNLALERNRTEKAEGLLTEGIELVAKWNFLSTIDGHLTLATLHHLQGDHKKLNEKLAELHDLAKRFDATEIDDMIVDLVEAGIKARLGDSEVVRKWISHRGLEQAPDILPEDYAEDYLLGRIYKYELPVVIRFLLASERFDEATSAIDELIDLAEKANRPFLVLEGLILKAIMHHALSQQEESLSALHQALEIAAPARAARLFLAEGQILTDLLKELRPALKSHELVEFVDRLLIEPEHASLDDHTASEESLSPRELDILRLLPSELTAEELAAELIISVNTVRTHMKNIYAKLDVHSRHQAVDKARRLQLI